MEVKSLMEMRVKMGNFSFTKFCLSMKHFLLYSIAILLSLPGFCQQTGTVKPKLFNTFPDIINCSVSELASVFNSTEGQNINLSFSNNFIFGGMVISKVTKYSNLQSAIIKSPVFNNAIFHISKRINTDNSITYVGRIINQNYFDGYELKTDAFGNYHLLKIETDSVIQIDSF